jgi:N terminus of Rad21 / Rec8 like protein
MFYSNELLSKRDSGFGLLWYVPTIVVSIPHKWSRLAATLGSKSTLKKLTKKSVLTADISLLCEQIGQPSEPLALRLSSNLMVGVARVYKCKSISHISVYLASNPRNSKTRNLCYRRDHRVLYLEKHRLGIKRRPRCGSKVPSNEEIHCCVSLVQVHLVTLSHPSSFDKITMTVDHENFLDFDLDTFGFVSHFCIHVK